MVKLLFLSKNFSKITLLGVLITSVAGCATLSKQDCQVADWQAIGERDGTNGRAMDYLQQHAKACGRVDIVPNKTQWEQGRQAGLKRYCTPSNAFQVGTAGKSLNLVCPQESLASLGQANQKGLQVYAMTEQISTDKANLEKYVEEYRKMRDGSNLDFKTEKEARAYLLGLPEKIRYLHQRVQRNEAELTRLRGW